LTSTKITDLVNRHDKYRKSTINLIPSENVMSKTARNALASDLAHRYHHTGASFILFPHPVREISDLVEDIGALLIYDGSHVLGLIAGGEFQDPLREGAQILLGSTHKTFPGPQGGIILTNDEDLAKNLSEFLGFPPVMVDDPHVNRIAALGITVEEMIKYGKDYAKHVINNAKFFAKKMHKLGLNVAYPDKDFTESHQIHLREREFSFSFFTF